MAMGCDRILWRLRQTDFRMHPIMIRLRIRNGFPLNPFSWIFHCPNELKYIHTLVSKRYQLITFRTKRRISRNSNLWISSSLFKSSCVNFQSKTVLSAGTFSSGCARLYSPWKLFNKLLLKMRWSFRRQMRFRFFDRLELCVRDGERRMFTLPIFGHTGFPLVVVVFGMGFPWPSEHQHPAPPIHWTAAYVPSERHLGTNFLCEADRCAIAYVRVSRHSVYE